MNRSLVFYLLVQNLYWVLSNSLTTHTRWTGRTQMSRMLRPVFTLSSSSPPHVSNKPLKPLASFFEKGAAMLSKFNPLLLQDRNSSLPLRHQPLSSPNSTINLSISEFIHFEDTHKDKSSHQKSHFSDIHPSPHKYC